MKYKKTFIFSILFFLLFIISIEIFLRRYYGFCDAVLVQEDNEIEYIPQPNQNRFRFRNRILYNSLSMRSPEVDTSSLIILGFGDSVINGGVQTDQDSLATTILSDSLSTFLKTKVQFLNISYGSWGPDNCYKYLARNGHFDAKAIFLVISSHDAYDNINFDKVVDVHESFPSKQYVSAIFELIDRYLIPRFFPDFKAKNELNNLAINKKQKKSRFNEGFNLFKNYCNLNRIPLIIYLHAEQSEQEKKCYNKQGLEIIDFAKQNKIKILTDLNELKNLDYRDNIHINSSGQKKMAKIIYAFYKK